jgi:hypothetical protein
MTQLLLWAVFIVGPNTMIPLHHAPPLFYQDRAKCEEEIPFDLDKVITFVDPEYHLECVSVPDLTGEPV